MKLLKHYQLILLLILFSSSCSKESDPAAVSGTNPSGSPILTTSAPASITATSVISGGAISSQGSDPVLSRGVCYSLTANPKISDNATSDGTGIGVFQSTITNLRANTLYYMRAYAINSKGTAYGNEITFTTLPLISTNAITNIRLASAASGGTISNAGGVAITEKGICFSTSTAPTTADNKVISGTGIANFTSSMSGLTAATKYYVRAYAIYNGFTTYGSEISFTTTPGIGDTHQGGVVLYLLQAGDIGYDPNVLHGIILAVGNGSSTWFGRPPFGSPVPWGPSTLVGTSTAIGTGKANTSKIIAAGASGSATKFCDDLVYNGYSDWYLPSRDELVKIIANSKLNNNVGEFDVTSFTVNAICLSSSEVDQSKVHLVRWDGLFTDSKDGFITGQRTVRAVRSF